MDEKQDDRENQHEVNRPARHMERDEAEQPDDEQNHSECQEHGAPPFVTGREQVPCLRKIGSGLRHSLRKVARHGVLPHADNFPHERLPHAREMALPPVSEWVPLLSAPLSDRPAVLLVEDDRDLGDAVAVILEDEGYAVARAANGLEALDRLREETRFCAVLLDARMPVMSGLEFRRLQLREPGMAESP